MFCVSSGAACSAARKSPPCCSIRSERALHHRQSQRRGALLEVLPPAVLNNVLCFFWCRLQRGAEVTAMLLDPIGTRPSPPSVPAARRASRSPAASGTEQCSVFLLVPLAARRGSHRHAARSDRNAPFTTVSPSGAARFSKSCRQRY